MASSIAATPEGNNSCQLIFAKISFRIHAKTSAKLIHSHNETAKEEDSQLKK